jgi:flavin-binding protein dodecin
MVSDVRIIVSSGGFRRGGIPPLLRIHRRIKMAQKVIKVVGTSKESFAKAAANAVAEAAKTVRNLKWARVAGLEMELDGKNITQYRTTTNIYFDIEE